MGKCEEEDQSERAQANERAGRAKLGSDGKNVLSACVRACVRACVVHACVVAPDPYKLPNAELPLANSSTQTG